MHLRRALSPRRGRAGKRGRPRRHRPVVFVSVTRTAPYRQRKERKVSALERSKCAVVCVSSESAAPFASVGRTCGDRIRAGSCTCGGGAEARSIVSHVRRRPASIDPALAAALMRTAWPRGVTVVHAPIPLVVPPVVPCVFGLSPSAIVHCIPRRTLWSIYSCPLGFLAPPLLAGLALRVGLLTFRPDLLLAPAIVLDIVAGQVHSHAAPARARGRRFRGEALDLVGVVRGIRPDGHTESKLKPTFCRRQLRHAITPLIPALGGGSPSPSPPALRPALRLAFPSPWPEADPCSWLLPSARPVVPVAIAVRDPSLLMSIVVHSISGAASERANPVPGSPPASSRYS